MLPRGWPLKGSPERLSFCSFSALQLGCRLAELTAFFATLLHAHASNVHNSHVFSTEYAGAGQDFVHCQMLIEQAGVCFLSTSYL